MRTIHSTRLTLCAALVAHTTACTDDLGDAPAVDVADGPADGPAVLGDLHPTRNCPPLVPTCNLGNSPWVGSWSFSNVPHHDSEPALDPYGLVTFELDDATKVINEQQQDVELVVSDLGQMRARYSNTEYDIAGTTLTFTVDPVGAGATTTVSLMVKSETIPATGTYLRMPRYEVLTDVAPIDTDIFPEDTEFEGWYPVCPQAEGTNRAIVLPKVSLAYDGELAALANQDATVVLACERQALAKGATKLEVLPNTGHTIIHANGTVNRQFGTLNYNALVNAYRAFFDGEARTTEGTTIYLKDLAHDPPMFDQAVSANLPPPPIMGYEAFFLESVYDGAGAHCRSYTAQFPYGVHRNASYSPPGLMLSGWDDLGNCVDAGHTLTDYGSVAVYQIRHVIPVDTIGEES